MFEKKIEDRKQFNSIFIFWPNLDVFKQKISENRKQNEKKISQTHLEKRKQLLYETHFVFFFFFHKLKMKTGNKRKPLHEFFSLKKKKTKTKKHNTLKNTKQLLYLQYQNLYF